jgi:hypothetical protein
VRERAGEIFAAGLAGGLAHFRIEENKLTALADFVADVIRRNYPGLNVPLHARWRHFVVNGRDLWAGIAAGRDWPDRAARARAEFDLAIVSVLLDAGAGPDWRYADAATGITLDRSEGLALASLRMFESGLFSADPCDPLRADAAKLAALTISDLAAGFQVTADNPLAGLAGRATLLQRLGETISINPAIFAAQDTPRPGGLFDTLASAPHVSAPDILRALLVHLGPIWPGRLRLGGIALGDTWRHRVIRRYDATDGMVPLHKLSQWLAYSLVEPLMSAGIDVAGLDELTGLAEYRNGGLFVDGDILVLRDPQAASRPNAVDSELVVEWRALTVALLDRLAPLVREWLGVTTQAFPLGCLLEGGTWSAGRLLARRMRSDGAPPIRVDGDGTVF